MYDTFPDQSKKTIANLSENINGVALLKLYSGFHKFSNVAIAKLLNDIVVFATFHNINETNDVRVVKGLHYFDLFEEG